jgi:CheY-like chemotaxis protein
MQQDFTVMLVDDDDDYSFLAKRILKKSGIGTNILTASNGLEAFQLLKDVSANEEKLPLLILLDLKMPIMDGFEFLEEAGKLPASTLTRTRIYVTTSSVLPKDREKANHYPITGYIPKPITPDILREILSTKQ